MESSRIPWNSPMWKGQYGTTRYGRCQCGISKQPRFCFAEHKEQQNSKHKCKSCPSRFRIQQNIMKSTDKLSVLPRIALRTHWKAFQGLNTLKRIRKLCWGGVWRSCPSFRPSVLPSVRPSVRPSVHPSFVHPSILPSVLPSVSRP